MKGSIYRINVKPMAEGERGLPKQQILACSLEYEGLVGDYNRYRQEKREGDLSRAVLLMPLEMIRQLNQEGWPVEPGDVGENITTQGIDYHQFELGKMYIIVKLLSKFQKPQPLA